MFEFLAEEETESGDGLLPDSFSISRVDDLLMQMKFREMPKRTLFSIPFEIGEGFVIGVKGYVVFIRYLSPTISTAYKLRPRVRTEKGAIQIFYGPR